MTQIPIPQGNSGQKVQGFYPLQMPERMATTGFTILDHIDRLNVVKETSREYHCACPVCGDGGFKIDKKSGKYNTFKCGCMDTPEGRKAIIAAVNSQQSTVISYQPPVNKPPATYQPLVIDQKSPLSSDRQQKAIRPKGIRTWVYRDRQGNPIARVYREDFGDGSKPDRWQERWVSSSELGVRSSELGESQNYELRTKNYELGKWVTGLDGLKREDIPIYRYQEIQQAIAAGQTIFIAEGEPACDAFWEIGIPATTNIGGSGQWKPSDSKDLAGAKIVLCPDRDKPGVKHMDKIAQDFPDAQWLYAYPNSPFWYNLPPNQGVDAADWLADFNLGEAKIWEAVEPRREGLPDPKIPTTPPKAKKNYSQQCVDDLYSDKPWVSINGKLYFWTGTHYQEADVAVEKRRIADWCNTTAVQRGNQLVYAYATANHVNNIWKWLLASKGVAAERVNPPGLNCLNGVVKLNLLTLQASWDLQPHNPNEIYTYVSEIEYDPNADPTQCDRMLSCLEPAQQKLFIQTLAASLDLETIRKHRGRKIKALLCKGDGNNGKDTLREAISILYGGIGLSDASRGISLGEANGKPMGSQWEANGEGKNLDTARVGSQLSQFSQVGEIFEQVGSDAFLSGLTPTQLIELQQKINQLASQADTERVTGFPTDFPTAFPTDSQLPSQPDPERVSASSLDEDTNPQLASQADTERLSAPSSVAQELPDEEIDPWIQPEERQESAELGSHNSQRLIEWVRYQGEVWQVARQNEYGMLWLRQAGFSKIIHKVPVSQVEIGGYL